MSINNKYIVIDDAVTDQKILSLIENDKSFFPETKELETGDVNRVDGSPRTPIEYTFWPGWTNSADKMNAKEQLIKHLCDKILPIELDGSIIKLEDIYGFEHWARSFLPGQFSCWHYDKGFGKGVDKTLNNIFVQINSDNLELRKTGYYNLGRVFAVKYSFAESGKKFILNINEVLYNFSFNERKFSFSEEVIKIFIQGIIYGLTEVEDFFQINTQEIINLLQEKLDSFTNNELVNFIDEIISHIKEKEDSFAEASSFKDLKCGMGLIYYPSFQDPNDKTYLQLYISNDDGDEIVEIECKPNRLLIFNSGTVYHQSTPPKSSIRYSFPVNIWLNKKQPSKLEHFFFDYRI